MAKAKIYYANQKWVNILFILFLFTICIHYTYSFEIYHRNICFSLMEGEKSQQVLDTMDRDNKHLLQ